MGLLLGCGLSSTRYLGSIVVVWTLKAFFYSKFFYRAWNRICASELELEIMQIIDQRKLSILIQ